MSERLLCGDAQFSVSLVMDDLVPLHCTAVHFINASPQVATLVCTVSGSQCAITFDPGTDQTWTLPSPVAVQTTVTFKGGSGWSVPGLTNYSVRQGGSSATGTLPTDIAGCAFYANVSTGLVHNAGGQVVALPGSIAHNAAPV